MKTTNENRKYRVGMMWGLSVALAMSVGVARAAEAAEGEPAAKVEAEAADDLSQNHYGEKGAWELGGNVAFSVLQDSISLSVTPNFGYFIANRIELSALVSAQYEWTRNDDGSHTNTASGLLEFEPSYHYPLSERFLVFGGLGMGPGFNGDTFEFDLVPRAGVNIKLGKHVVFTPAVRVPIEFSPTEVTPGLLVEAGVGGTW